MLDFLGYFTTPISTKSFGPHLPYRVTNLTKPGRFVAIVSAHRLRVKWRGVGPGE